MGSKVSHENDVLKIQIGGDELTNQKKRHKPYNRIKTTKYTWLTFLPLNLWEQFHRLVYIYYLIVTIISFFVNNTISPWTSLIPLVFVIAVSAIKQGREEYLRYKTDKIVNSSPVTVLRDGELLNIAAQYVAPGDLVVVERDCDVPCDLVLLHTTDEHGKCFVTTANLDGETNLKTLIIARELPKIEKSDFEQLGWIECENSKTDLYDFNGKLHLAGVKTTVIPLSAENLLLSGAHVKNTDYVIGCAVYTGMLTKLQLNSRLSSNKAASSDGYINRFLLFLVIVMVLFVTVLYFLERQDELFVVPLMSYLGPPININKITEIIDDYLSFLVIVNYMIPVSMYMNIELYRVFSALFLTCDLGLYDEETDQPCVVNTSNLTEELGQINILFSDKTGTLTKNEMIFQQCSINGVKFVHKCDHLERTEEGSILDINEFDANQYNFFQALCICHTVQVSDVDSTYEVDNTGRSSKNDLSFLDTDKSEKVKRPAMNVELETLYDINIAQQANDDSSSTHQTTVVPKISRSNSIVSRESYAEPKYQLQLKPKSTHYQASSADEKSFVEACAELGITFLGDENEILRLHLRSEKPTAQRDLEFKRLHILEFTADRKRMSVIVEDPKGVKWIYAKGAESCIFPLCSETSSEMISKTDEHITEFAKYGLRTLAIARRRLLEEEYKDFLEELAIANSSLDSRKELCEILYAKVENKLELLGATAVEDALQDEVAETLELLQRAGLKIWVLTGDKVETAANIALACGHIPQQATKHFILNCRSKDEMLISINSLETDLQQGGQIAVLIDGDSLAVALNDTPNEFREVTMKCCAVLCCRLSPLQKSQVIGLIKSANKNFITAAIGDGANDVSMIQEAHVGIGIMGKEGRQAARSADFAIAKFSMLKRLLLVHGHYNSVRLAFLVLFYCYKNVVITGNMFLFQFNTLFSSTSVYHSLFLWLYDIVYISGGMTYVTLIERPYSEETLLSRPELYKENANNKQARWTVFLLWMLNGLYQTLVIYLFGYYAMTTNDIIWNNGQTADFYCFGIILVQIVIFVENIKLLFTAKLINNCFVGIILISMMAFVLTTIIYNVIDTGSDLYFIYNYLLTSFSTWLFMIVTIVACLLPDYTYAVFNKLTDLSFLRITSTRAA